MVKSSILISFVVLLASCNLFELKEAEYPDGPGRRDPFNFNYLLSQATSSGETFKTLNYEDIFSSDMQFESSVSTKRISRSEVIETLQYYQSEQDYVSGMRWQINRVLNDGKRISLFDVEYSVYQEGIVTFSGKADFKVERELEWKITYWKDYPDDETRPFLNLR
ncbi:hypothetical protein QA601_08195 [Chitinispirillales bacterium ANBcel5]|uniref:hypothetical protein n=1 Tax=Cellulosispirillum alkaliphilum TaxID=3039283 RepID=UPI002A54C369|nr:hypothetical protein [Chitinispirillales bacterium ANBcel5]